MPELLKRLNKIFPEIKFTQTYGLSEVGILNKSKSSRFFMGKKKIIKHVL